MMQLSTMWKVDSTVDSAGNSPVAELILENWAHEAGSVRFFRSSANFLYTFQNVGQRYFLRFADSSERSRGAIEAEVDLLTWLAGAGIRVPPVIPARNGEFVTTTAMDLGTFHAVVFSALQGAQYELDDLDDRRFREWGAALGRLHRVLKEFPGRSSTARRSWRDDLDQAGKHIPLDALAIRNERDAMARLLNHLPVDDDSYGLIHFDFELDNLLWGQDGIGILDFDDSAHYWYAADIASALRDLFSDGSVDLTKPAFLEFIQGYAAECPLDEAAIGQVPLFLRLSRLLQYTRINRSLDLRPDEAYPAWLTRLAGKLRKRLIVYRASLHTDAE